MLIRIRFSKTGMLRFIGHLDVMRYFQKLLGRSGLPVKYSQGFHPHQIMSFASPLGIGLTSDGEYMDFELEEERPLMEIENALQSSLSDGFFITKVVELSPRVMNVKKLSSMALVDSADYYIYEKSSSFSSLSKEKRSDYVQLFQSKTNDLFFKNQIVVNKKTKTASKEIDIKPFVFSIAFDYPSFIESKHLPQKYLSSLCNNLPATEGRKLFLHLSAGSIMNLKPETVLEAILSETNPRMDSSFHTQAMTSMKDEESSQQSPIFEMFGIHRLELYHKEEGNYVPLWDIK